MLPSSLPTSRVPDSRDAPVLRWGILGTGWIADQFVAALRGHTDQVVYAVGSRHADSAAAFARAHGIEVAHGSYDALLADSSVDVVYVATPHNHHLAPTLAAISAGKHVVVEKPIGVTAAEAEEIAAAARAAGVFCAEAMWTLFLPKFDVIRQLLDDGAIGEPRTVVADMSEAFPYDHRVWQPDLAGGPMLDLGTYPVALAGWVLGEPSRVTALSVSGPTGVDAQVGAVLGTGTGALATIQTSLEVLTPTAATIGGRDGEIVVDGFFYRPGRFVLRDHAGAELSWDEPAVGHQGLHFEATAFARDIAAGRTESAVRPLADSIATLRTMDRIAAAAAAHSG